MEIARKIAAKHPKVIRAAKEAMNGIDPVPPHNSYRYEQGFTFELNLQGVGNELREEFLDR
jgi:enoyl-CoA hydratase